MYIICVLRVHSITKGSSPAWSLTPRTWECCPFHFPMFGSEIPIVGEICYERSVDPQKIIALYGVQVLIRKSENPMVFWFKIDSKHLQPLLTQKLQAVFHPKKPQLSRGGTVWRCQRCQLKTLVTSRGKEKCGAQDMKGMKFIFKSWLQVLWKVCICVVLYINTCDKKNIYICMCIPCLNVYMQKCIIVSRIYIYIYAYVCVLMCLWWNWRGILPSIGMCIIYIYIYICI